tara:strand:+ start:144 stop:503 length:360 start_codon:yes stop_codon:yes gene_type:complete
MLKKVLAVAAVSAASSTPVFAGFYLNVENNATFLKDSDFQGSSTDLHVGYEKSSDRGSFYLQGGPLLSNPEGKSQSTDVSAKIGGSVNATDKTSIYGELSGVFADENVFGTKLGLKFAF